MLRQRYYIYLFYLNAMVNVIAFIPQILYRSRFNGSITSLFLATLCGITLIILFQTQIKNFPGKNISEIMRTILPRGIQKTFLLLNFTLSTFSGILFLNSIILVIEEFSDLDSTTIFYCLLILIVFTIMIQTNSILFMLEITALFVTPFIILIVLRFFTDKLVWIDSINQSFTYLLYFPKMSSVISALFVFTGITNLLVYSEFIRPLNKKHLYIIVGIICFILYASYFIPIGYFGLNGVGKENYVWVTVTDNLKIDYFFLERVVIVFILILIGLTLMYTILSYHSSIKTLQMMAEGLGGKLKWTGIFIVASSSIVTHHYLNQMDLLSSFLCFFIFRTCLDLILIFILMWASRKQRQR